MKITVRDSRIKCESSSGFERERVTILQSPEKGVTQAGKPSRIALHG